MLQALCNFNFCNPSRCLCFMYISKMPPNLARHQKNQHFAVGQFVIQHNVLRWHYELLIQFSRKSNKCFIRKFNTGSCYVTFKCILICLPCALFTKVNINKKSPQGVKSSKARRLKQFNYIILHSLISRHSENNATCLIGQKVQSVDRSDNRLRLWPTPANHCPQTSLGSMTTYSLVFNQLK